MFDKVIGYADLKKELEMMVDTITHPEKYKDLDVVPPRNVLLYGSPGM